MGEATSGHTISVIQLRCGIVLLIIWWLPVYLVVPTLVASFGDEGDHHAIVVITAMILIVQTIVGIAGLLLTGKELASTLQKVKFKKLPITIWRMVWTGNTTIDPLYLKPPKIKKASAGHRTRQN